MTELQKKELEMLKLFINICNEFNLTYYLVCGSALGAVKYKGFIPWDDDIDVALPRCDYEVFLNKAQGLLPDWCFLQNYRTDTQFYLLGSKMRDSRTTYIEKMCGKLQINHGIFIDVFPLDGHWTEKADQNTFLKYQREFEAKRRVRLDYNRFSRENILSIRTNVYHWLFKFFNCYGNTPIYIEKFEKFVSSFDTRSSDVWCNHANSASSVEYAPKEQYGEGTWATFEGLQVRIPEKYDEYLTQKYGNWRADLPPEEQYGHHHYEVFDIERPYTYYIKNK